MKPNRFFTVLMFFAAFAFTTYGQTNYLDRVEELQQTAAKANGGALGCGAGMITIVTSNGEVTTVTGLDPIHVFGKRVVAADLLILLQARADSNRTGKQNPMSGHVNDLGYVILSTLAISKDPAVIPVIAELLHDKEDRIRRSSVLALIQLADSDENLKSEIEKISFPKSAIKSAYGNSSNVPDWIHTEDPQELPTE